MEGDLDAANLFAIVPVRGRCDISRNDLQELRRVARFERRSRTFEFDPKQRRTWGLHVGRDRGYGVIPVRRSGTPRSAFNRVLFPRLNCPSIATTKPTLRCPSKRRLKPGQYGALSRIWVAD
jgi:hypothetical protein